MNSSSPLFTIQQISQKCDVPKSTLRFWEKKFNEAIAPLRTQGGQRRYTAEHISIIEAIKKLRDKGASLSQTKQALSNGYQEGQTQPDQLDLLAARIAEVVRTEVYNFFAVEERNK
jgi:DNA-binding transcriptional MerR regulator